MRKAVFWGMDSISAGVTERFSVFLDRIVNAGGRFTSFAPASDNCLEELRRRLHELQKQHAKDHSSALGDLNLVLLVWASSPEAIEKLQVLPEASQVLRDAIAGSCSITLVALLPSGYVEKEEKIQIFRFFLYLEGLLGTVVGLELVLAHEIDPGEIEEAGSSKSNCFHTLYRLILDDSLGRFARRIGSHAPGNQQKVDGRLAYYSTGGVRRFIYDASGCHRYLAARFQVMVFKKGLFNLTALAENKVDLAFIQARANNLSAQACQKLCAPPLSPPWNTTGQLSGRVSHEEYLETASRLKSATADLLDCVRDKYCWAKWGDIAAELVRADFREALSVLPGRLAGGQFYTRALLGDDIVKSSGEDGSGLTGVKLFAEKFCREPLMSDVENFCGTRAAAGQMERQAQLKEGRKKDLPEESARAEISRQPEQAGECVRFLNGCIKRIDDHSKKEFLDLSSIEELLEGVLEDFTSEAKRLTMTMEECGKSIDAYRQQLEALKQETPWLKRNISGRGKYGRQKEEKEGAIKELESSQALIQTVFEENLDCIATLLTSVIWPHSQRVVINQLFREALEAEAGRFHRFLSDVKEKLKEEWKQSRPKSLSGGVDVDVLSMWRIKKLCKDVSPEISPDDAVRDLLNHFSPKGWDGKKASRAYAKCRNLKDHYENGPETLLQRMEDQSRTRFKPVLDKTVIDILELEGGPQAWQFLQGHLAAVKPDNLFSSTLMPQMLNEGLPQKALAVRAGEVLAEQVGKREYMSILNDFWRCDSQVLEEGGSNCLDLTWFAFAFPACLIRSMEECRRLFHEKEGTDAGDLWPVS